MRKPTVVIKCLAVALVLTSRAPAQTIVSTFAENAQHTATYSAAAQQMDVIHWSTPIDLTIREHTPTTALRCSHLPTPSLFR
ncbi:MAG: hypothetical protein WCA49_19810 [Candidatus Sulfotelmatobacter sp.]